ncbi:MAG TPA: formate dehydrogenase accessory protein FdhE [Spirochaetota bacterium]|nr:formate dehydrogenase accessory protein FdhE [Spirochaetota bacterium]
MIKKSEYLSERKDDIVNGEILSEENYNFYLKLFEHQEEYTEKYSFKDFPSYIDKESFPALNAEKIALSDNNRHILIASLEGFVRIISEFHTGFSLERLLSPVRNDEDSLPSLLRSFLSDDHAVLSSVAADTGIGVEELVFIITNWFKPFIIKMRRDFFSERNTDEWLEKTCPFCGSYPDMVKIIEARDNSRFLHCSFCEQEWKFQRFGCTMCGNVIHEKMGFYEFEDSFYRFDYCDACKGYIKTLRVPQKNREDSFDLAVENIITNYLDASAIKMGYKKL